MNILSKNPLILLISAMFIALVSLSPLQAQDQSENAAQETDEDVIDLDELLEMVRQGINTQTQEFKAREGEFLAARNRQSQLRSQARQTQASEERRSVRLEAQAEANEQRIGVLSTQLRDKLGNLSEVFGVLQQVAGDTRSVFQVSHISLEFPGREEGLTALINKAAEGTDLPTIEEIEALWYEMQREMTESRVVPRTDPHAPAPMAAAADRLHFLPTDLHVGIVITVPDPRIGCSDWIHHLFLQDLRQRAVPHPKQ